MKPSVENCMQWVERDKKVIAPCSHLSYFPLVVAEAKQDMVYDEDGNGYIDFLSSASSLNLGSGQPAVHAAVMDQMGKGTQYTIAYSYNRASIEYAERPDVRLSRRRGGQGLLWPLRQRQQRRGGEICPRLYRAAQNHHVP